MATMRLEIITVERQVYSDDVEVLVAPGIDGQLGILPHHAPLMTALQPGEIMVRKSGEATYLAVSGGFLEVIGNKVTILADTAERSDEIDEARSREAVQRARDQLARRGATLEMEQALRAVRRAEARLNVVRRRRGRDQVGARLGGGQSGGAH